MEWMIMPLKRYADFQGRSRRKEYWMFFLLIMICYAVILTIGGVIAAFGTTATTDSNTALGLFVGPVAILFVLFALAVLVPSLAVQVRRFHDQDKSGWFVLLALIPYIGGIAVLVFMCLEGTKGPNKFGPDPKNPEGDLTSVFR